MYHIERGRVIVDQIRGLRIRLTGRLRVRGSKILEFVLGRENLDRLRDLTSLQQRL